MNSESEPTQTSTPTTQPLNIPLAIIIAGGLIAIGIYLGGAANSSPSKIAATDDTGEVTSPTARPKPAQAIGEVRAVTSEDHIRGASDAKVTVIEYSDLECPFCKRFHPTMQQIVSEYPNDVRWVYRHAPLEQLHSKAAKEAEATECAGEQGKFWELTDKIFEVTPANNGLVLADLPKLAREAGVANISQFQSCLDSGKYAQHVQDDFKDAQSAGMRGTPYSIVIAPNGDKLPISGAQQFTSVKATIDQALGN